MHIGSVHPIFYAALPETLFESFVGDVVARRRLLLFKRY